MKLIKTFLINLFILCGAESIKIPPNTPEWYSKLQEFLEAPLPEGDVVEPAISENQIDFFLFTKNNRPFPINLTEENLDKVGVNADKLFVVIHGWCENRERQWLEDMKNALLDSYPTSYVIEVDWSDPAFDFYPNSAASVKSVGRIIGDFLISIHNKRKVSTKNMIILGHSLGSHVGGFTAKRVQNVLPKISRIVGMDPAGPLWESKPCEKRLCGTDADVVEALHTDAGGLGYTSMIGTIDFYPNGGYEQKGCKNSTSAMDCDHVRSYTYVIEAIGHPSHFVSKKCADWKTYEENQDQCEKATISLGDFQTKERGIFFFATHEKPPYAMENGDDIGSPAAAPIWKYSVCFLVVAALFCITRQ